MMSGSLTFRFYGGLNDFLAAEQRRVDFVHWFREQGSVKDVIESLGVPHTEVDLILVDGTPVGYDHLVSGGEHISVFPSGGSRNIARESRLQAPPPAARFVLDTHLGRLAAYLRMLGFDTLYQNDYDDPELAEISSMQQRILLSRDKKLLMRKQVEFGYYVRARMPHEQLIEVLKHYKLFDRLHPFTRCMHCNGTIRPVPKQVIVKKLMPRTKELYEEFWQCRDCGKIYWKGSHYRRMEEQVAGIANLAPGD
jgi:uncharacterized protein with PIN domain